MKPEKFETLMFYWMLGFFTAGIGILVDIILRVYTGEGIRKRLGI